MSCATVKEMRARMVEAPAAVIHVGVGRGSWCARRGWGGASSSALALPGACRCIESSISTSNRPDAVTTQGLATSGPSLLKAIAIAEQLRRSLHRQHRFG